MVRSIIVSAIKDLTAEDHSVVLSELFTYFTGTLRRDRHGVNVLEPAMLVCFANDNKIVLNNNKRRSTNLYRYIIRMPMEHEASSGG